MSFITDLSEVDVVSNAVYLDDVPFDQFAALRREAPLFRQSVPDPDLVDYVWVASTQAVIREISVNIAVFSSNANGVRLDRSRVSEGVEVQNGNFIMLDDPRHREQRKKVSPGFTPRAIRAFDDVFRTLAADIVSRALENREFDAVADLAVHVPVTAICTLLGVPQQEHQRVLAWSDAVVGLADPTNGGSREKAGMAVREVAGLALRLAEEKRRRPADDLLSILANAPEEERLSDSELTGFLLLLLIAGNESTRNTTSHSILALAQNPDELDWLGEDPDERVAGSIDEMIRWASPLTFMSRTAIEDVEVAGQQLKAGDRVAMFYCSANRDETVFDRPDEFRLDRQDAIEHMSFGVGSHSCLGASLARVELGAIFREFASRVERVEVIGSVERLQSSWVRGIKRLPVRVTLR